MKRISPTKDGSNLTMTVGELIEELKKFDESLPVAATWEGVYRGFRSENFYIKKPYHCDVLVIDVED